jgi:hypothetical protein
MPSTAQCSGGERQPVPECKTLPEIFFLDPPALRERTSDAELAPSFTWPSRKRFLFAIPLLLLEILSILYNKNASILHDFLSRSKFP